LASSTTSVRVAVETPACVAQVAAPLTASVDRARPANESTQNGSTSAPNDRRPDLPHTHRRFSSKDGTVPTAVATTLAQPSGIDPVATSAPSTVRLTVVEISETVA
jgi:hypothetical protein